MSWLSDNAITYNYECLAGHRIQDTRMAREDRADTLRCECGLLAEYKGFDPVKLGQTTIIEYEKNGIKALEIKTPARTTHISKTKYDYVRTGKVQYQYSRAYTEHLQKTDAERLHVDTNQRRAVATAIKDLPQGEFVSDGVNVKQIN